MGKSRLARELMGWARSRPILVCMGRADPMAAGSSYTLAGRSLRGLLGTDESLDPEGRVAAIARRCADLGIDRGERSLSGTIRVPPVHVWGGEGRDAAT